MVSPRPSRTRREEWGLPRWSTGAEAPAYCHCVPLGRDDGNGEVVCHRVALGRGNGEVVGRGRESGHDEASWDVMTAMERLSSAAGIQGTTKRAPPRCGCAVEGVLTLLMRAGRHGVAVSDWDAKTVSVQYCIAPVHALR